jgi:type VI secretion system protein ImpA
MYEIESLLKPISEDQPTGPDLRLDPGDLTFQTLKDYTAVVEASLAESEEEIREANWGGVVGLCIAALSEKSKDLEIITSLCSGWVHTEGIGAVAHGLELLHRSLETCWDQLHPGYDPEDDELNLALRARWLNWMDSPRGFILAIKQTPIGSAGDGATYCWLDHENSEMLEDANTSPERRQELIDAGFISDAQWLASIGGVPRETMVGIVEELGKGMESCRAMREFCAERFGDEDSPDFYNLINVLEELHDYLREQIGDDETEGAGAEAELSTGEATSGGGTQQARGPIGNRQAALKLLQEVGDYFRRTEPHSPISYLIARAVKWGAMPLDQLYRDVVRSDDVIEHIWETLGLDSPNSEDDDQ